MKHSLAALLTVKTAAAAIVLTSMGGVAVAAMDIPFADKPHKAAQAEKKAAKALAHSAKEAGKDAKKAERDAKKAERDAKKAGKHGDDTGRGSSASFAGLCTAYFAGAKDNGKALQSPAFIRLRTAAGEAGVPAFCAPLAHQKNAADAGKKTGDKGKSAAAHAKAAAKGKSAAAREAHPDNGKAGAAHGQSLDAHGKAGVDHS